ncbi:MAG: hypothetical protein DMF49_07125 [Acidobacteria bacterium]|nr:MAG: hypothetical protein DMF49_07125 [Acidobacteriota bacterium]
MSPIFIRSSMVRSSLAVSALAAASIVAGSGSARASGITNSADDLRTGWYSDQQSLTPQLVSSGPFSQVFSTPITGQVYAQPLVYKGSLIVATEANWVYRIDPENGNIFWSKNLGPAWNASDIGCGDLTPTIGVTGTPVIDDTTDTIYLFSKSYESGTSGPAIYYVHALDVFTGGERTGFPVHVQGTAQNNPNATFDPTKQLQRPGLLLMDGVVYAAFGGHCDITVWRGWIFGVSTSGQIKARWVSRSGSTNSGAAVWHSGGALVSDGPGRIFVSTGNGGSPTSPIPGNMPPANLGNSIVHLQVQPDGTLNAVDFFTPYNASTLDTFDQDLGSCGPTGLPSQYFGTPAHPNLMFTAGKEGYVYLLDRDSLGGCKQAANGRDNVVDRKGNYGGVWSHPAVWPGDGGYFYLPHNSPGPFRIYKYGLDGTGNPSIQLVASSSDNFGLSSSAPVVTSDGTTSGSALVWIVRDVGARDGHVLSFGPPVINLLVTKSADVHLAWSGGNAPYRLRRAADARFTSPVVLLDHSSATSFDDPVLGDGNSYFYLLP